MNRIEPGLRPAPGAGKQEWRRWARRLRRPGVSAALSRAVSARVAGWLSAAGPPGAVVLYLPLPDEVDLTPVMEEAPEREYAVTRTPRLGPLTLHPADAPLETHPYGFRQPTASAPALPAHRVGVVLVPGLLFDRRGGRLGRGKGYYDRFLASLPAGARRVGAALDHLVVEALPVEPHDIAMTHLATERGVRETGA